MPLQELILTIFYNQNILTHKINNIIFKTTPVGAVAAAILWLSSRQKQIKNFQQKLDLDSVACARGGVMFLYTSEKCRCVIFDATRCCSPAAKLREFKNIKSCLYTTILLKMTNTNGYIPN